MSQVVDTKVVEMQFDNSKFEKNIEVSLNSLKNLNKSIDDAGKNRNSLDELAKASDQVGISFDNMNMKSRISLNLFDMIAGVGTKAFNRISDAVAGFALNMANSLSGMQAMRDGFNEYELKMGSVQTILAGAKIIDPNSGKELKNEADRLAVVNQRLEDLNKYSDRTIYSFKDMTSNIGKFTNAGVNLDDAVDAIQGVANVAALSGANAGEASRAMYNFAQALSSGYVKLIDWKSIENANMATVDFKQQLLDTALALGTVRKEGEMYITTTTDANGKVSEAFNATKMFNDSLSNQWMTTDVLTTTLKKYTDESTELGKKAFAAATEVKTFSQMMDTLKESLGSGWAQSFEIIFGNFTEAKELWTRLNNTIDGLLSPIGQARNDILQIWKDNGGRDAVIESFANLYHAVQNLLSPLKELWKAFTPNLSHTGKGLAKISKWLEKITGLVAKGAGVVGRALATVLKPVIFVGSQIGKLLMRLYGLLSRTVGPKVIGFFSSIGKAVKSFSDTITTAFDKHITSRIKAFQTTLATTFANIKKRVKESKTINSLVKAFNELRNIIHDLFSRVMVHATMYANHFALYLKRIWEAIKPLVSNAFTAVLKTLANLILPKLRKAFGHVTDKLKEFGQFIGKIDITNSRFYKGLKELPDRIKAISDNKTFKTVFSGIKSFGSEALTFLSKKFSDLKASVDSIKMPNGLKDLFDNIKNFIRSIFGKDSVNDELSKTLEETVGATDKVADEKSGEKLTAFQKFLKGISDAFNWLKNAAKTAKDAIADFIGFIVTNTPKAAKAFYNFLAGDDGLLTMTDITDAIAIVSSSFSEMLANFGVAEIGKASKNFSEAMGKFADAAVTFAKRIGNKWNMEAMRDFAIGVGILVASLWVLSKIPTDKLIVATGVLVGLGYALVKFFEMVSSASADLTKTVGFIPIAILLISIGTSMMMVAASLGILVGALAIFPKVIKQYNNLGDQFSDGMKRVKEVLEQIFEYLDHAAGSKYSFRSAMALIGLVMALSRLQKVILKFASKKMADSMADGLQRISQVLGILGSFLSGIQLGSFSFINIGIDFDTVGMAAIILALGFMIDKITPAIEKLSKLTPSQFETAFDGLKKILTYFGVFLAAIGSISFFEDVGLGKWLGIGAAVTLISFALSSCIESLSTLANLTLTNAHGLDTALQALLGIFIGLGILMHVIGKMENAKAPLFMLSLSIGLLTACIVALAPLADKNNPWKLLGPVAALSAVMISLGITLRLIGGASKEVSLGDVAKLIGVTIAMMVLTNAIRRLARTGGSAGGIAAAGVAIGLAAVSIAGAMKLLSTIPGIPITVLFGIGLLTAALLALAAVVKAFKGTGETVKAEASTISSGMEEATTGAAEGISSGLKMIDVKSLILPLAEKIGPALSDLFGNINIGEALRNMITSVKNDAKNWAQDFIDIGTNLIDGISTAISSPDNVAKVKESILALGQALLESFKLFFGIHSPSTVMAEQGGFILDGLVQGLMEFPSKLAGWVSSIGQFILSGITGLFTGAIEKGKGLIESVGTGIQNGKDFVAKKASEIGQAALQKVGKAKEWGKQALNSASAFGHRLQSGKGLVSKAAGGLVVGATSAIKGVVANYKASASAAAKAFHTSLSAGKGPAKSAAAAIVAGAKAAFNNISSSFRNFGVNAAQGFRNGINSLIASVAAKAREMVNKAKAAAKAAQNSNSPSKDFMEFGGWAAQGYALGMISRKNSKLIEENARTMVDTAKNAAMSTPFGTASFGLDSSPAIGSLAYAISQISDTLDETMNTSPMIRPVMDMSNVSNGASAISAMFGDKRFGASVDVMEHVKNDFDRTMSNRADAYSLKSIDKLASRINAMTDTMNSRAMNNYITIDGASDPNAFADELIRSFRLNARTV